MLFGFSLQFEIAGHEIHMRSLLGQRSLDGFLIIEASLGVLSIKASTNLILEEGKKRRAIHAF